MTSPTSRKEAIAAGVPVFRTGKPCRRGHLSERQTASGTCVECLRLWRISKRGGEASKAYYEANKDAFKVNARRYQLTQKTERPWAGPIRTSRLRARERNLEHTLTSGWGKRTFNGVCAISGLPFRVDESGSPGPKPFSPTIDRIDPTKGYTPENSRFVLSCVNNFRGTMGDADMLIVAAAILIKSIRNGGGTLEVSEYLTTQVCSTCGTLPLSRPRGIAGLSKRIWQCDDCETVHDRDQNAARNILRIGLDTLAGGTSC